MNEDNQELPQSRSTALPKQPKIERWGKNSITKTRLFKYTGNFTTKKWKITHKNYIFHISSQNKDCGYSLEPPRRGGSGYSLEQPRRGASNEYQQSMFLSRNKKNTVYPCKPQRYYIKVFMIRTKQISHIKPPTKREEMQQRNRLGTVTRKTTIRLESSFTSVKPHPYFLMQLKPLEQIKAERKQEAKRTIVEKDAHHHENMI